MRLERATHVGVFLAIFAMSVAAVAQQGTGQDGARADQPETRRVQRIKPANPNEHPFKLKSSTIELGDVRPGEPALIPFELFNASNRPVSVTRITTTCTCMSNDADLPRIVRAGETSEFSVTFKGRPNPGAISERVTIWYQNQEGREVSFALPIKGEIAFPVKADPFFVNLLQEDRTGTIELHSTDGVYFKVLSTGGLKPVFQGVRDGSKIAYDMHIIKYDFTDVPDDALKNFYVVQTTHPETPLLDLRMIHKGLLTQDRSKYKWSVSQDRFPLGRMRDGESQDITVHIVGMPEGDQMPQVSTTSEMLQAQVIEERPTEKRGRVFAIRFTLEGADEVLLHEMMTVSLGEQSKEFDLFVWANASE